VARRFYLLFQQQSNAEVEAAQDEFLDGTEGYHSIKYFGPQVAVLAIDMRTKRTKTKILPDVRILALTSSLSIWARGVMEIEIVNETVILS
jgi:PhoD related phosphatase